MMVKELLQLLVDKVDPQLLETVEIENFKSGDVQYTNEVITRQSLLIKSGVTFLDEPVEDASVQTLHNSAYKIVFKLLKLTNYQSPSLLAPRSVLY
jgi:divalent metal cation (Fe/Co/Zn/Cd) transporter